MSEQYQYEMNLRKDGLFINLSSDDVYFISRQMDKWFQILLDDRYVPVSAPSKKVPENPPVPALTSPPTPIAAATVATPPVQPSPVAPAQVETPIPEAPAAGPVISAPASTLDPVLADTPQAAPIPEAAPQPVLQAAMPAPEPIPTPLPVMPTPKASAPTPSPPPEAIPVAHAESAQPSLPPKPVSQDVPTALHVEATQAIELPPEMPAPVLPPKPIAPAAAEPAPVIPITPPPMAPISVEQVSIDSPRAAEPAMPDATEAVSPAAAADDFEAVMNSVMQDLEEPEPDPATAAAEEIPPPTTVADTGITLHQMIANQQQASQQDVPPLEDAVFTDELPATPPSVPESASAAGSYASDGYASLADLCDRANPNDTNDYLILAAYYISGYEHQETFSLKRLNGTLVKSGLSPVNHGALETALGEGTLTMVPDLTGTADVSEYRLSEQGWNTATALL